MRMIIGRWLAPLNLSVSNSLSGGEWQLDEVPAVGDPEMSHKSTDATVGASGRTAVVVEQPA